MLNAIVVAAKLLAAVSLVWTVYRLVDVAAAVLAARAKETTGKFDDLIVPFFRKSLKALVTVFGLVFIADVLEVGIGSLLAGIGIGGLALALAAQDAVKNFFGSLLVILDRPFHVGDSVVVSGVEGTVTEVGFRSTRIRTFYDSEITLPNGNLISAAVDNYGARRYRRWKTMLSLTYDTPPAKIEEFCEGVRELILNHPDTRKDSFHVYLNEFAPASLDVILYMFFEVPDWKTELAGKQSLGLDILRLAERIGVEFAFPTQTLYVHRAEDGTTEALPPGAVG